MDKRPPSPPEKFPKRPKLLSVSLIKQLKEKGLYTNGFIFHCFGDMDNIACFADAVLAFDDKGLYIVTGKEEALKRRKTKKHLPPPEPDFHIEQIRAIPLEDVDSLCAERYTSTGRLILNKDGTQEGIIFFSIGLIEEFENFVRAFNTYKETGTAKLPDKPGKKDFGDKPDGKKDKNKGTAVRLFKFFGGYVPQISAIIFIMILSSVVTVLVPQVSTKTLYDNVLANPDGNPASEMLKALGTLVLSIFGIRLLHTVLTMIQQYMSATITPKVMYDIKLKIFEAMQRLSVSFYSSKQTGSLMDRVTRDANNIYWFFTDGIPRMIIDFSTLVAVIAIMISMSPKLSLVVIAAIPLVAVMLVVGDKLFRRLHHSVWVHRSKMDSMISDSINGQRVIKAFAKEDDEFDRFNRASKGVMNSEIKLAVTESTLFPLLEIFVLLLSTVILGTGGVMIVKGESSMTTGTLLSFIVYLEMLKEPFGLIAWVSNWWSRCADSAQRVFEICDAQPDIVEKPNAIGLENIRGDVEIRQLEFEYEPARPIIKNLSLKVDAGKMLGIVGKTGAGKTTIANLIARLYDAKEGCVLIDGIDVKDLKLADLRKNIGLVSQDIYLFNGSIADNIRYANPKASMGEVIAAAKAACAHDFIMKLPDAYQTYVGAGAQALSGGERQRISIARTIIQNPKILILDEATAAMDTETERNIQASLKQLSSGRTVISIAHRLSTLRDSDELAVIDGGEIVEQGSFTDLIKLKGEFYKQYKIQSEALKTIGIAGDVKETLSDEEEEEKHG